MIGVNLQLFNGSTARANLTSIQALWWDVTEPKDGYRPIGKSSIVTTDANGYINLDLSSVTGLTTGDYGFLMLYKLDGTDHKDSLVFSGKVVTSNITSGVDMYYYDTGWTRPADWPALDAPVDGVQKIQGVYAVYNIETAGNAVAITVAGAYNVNWGDGTSADFATGVSAEHTYDYADTDLGSVTSRGYKCAVITITPQSGQNLTSVNFQDRHSTFTQVCDTPWLDITINGAYLTTITVSLSTRVVRTQKLEQVTIGQHAVTNMSYMFYYCYSLQSVPLFDTGAVTNMSYMFYSCYSLQSVPLFDTGAVTNMSYMFYYCYPLQSVPLFDTGAVTNMSYMFYICTSLQSVPLFDTGAVTNMSYMFYSCYSLQSVPLFDTGTVENISFMFHYCYSLQSVPLFDTGAVTNMSATFNYCTSLQYAALYNPRISFTVANCNLGPTALNAIYTNLGTGLTGKVITVTGNWGVASDNPALVPTGWSVTG